MTSAIASGESIIDPSTDSSASRFCGGTRSVPAFGLIRRTSSAALTTPAPPSNSDGTGGRGETRGASAHSGKPVGKPDPLVVPEDSLSLCLPPALPQGENPVDRCVSPPADTGTPRVSFSSRGPLGVQGRGEGGAPTGCSSPPTHRVRARGRDRASAPLDDVP